jgi:hypothetical protein
LGFVLEVLGCVFYATPEGGAWIKYDPETGCVFKKSFEKNKPACFTKTGGSPYAQANPNHQP